MSQKYASLALLKIAGILHSLACDFTGEAKGLLYEYSLERNLPDGLPEGLARDFLETMELALKRLREDDRYGKEDSATLLWNLCCRICDATGTGES